VIWHYSHVMAGAVIGTRCTLGQNVFVASSARIGNGVRIQNNVSVYDGVDLGDFVFCGPSCVFTNVDTPRCEVPRRAAYVSTLVRRGASIGANATIVCGVEIGRYALVGAGAVVTSDVPDYGLVVGVPARQVGWMSRHGNRLTWDESESTWRDGATGWKYIFEDGLMRCMDLHEESALDGTH
jgi:UDP-2-acetamido-3-amino-2,3-dideoxy-glucuronate N-acetyltransferase